MKQPALIPGKTVESRVGEIFGISIAFTCTTVLIVALRIFTRLKYVNQLRSDDYFILGSLGPVIFYGIDLCLQTQFGLGYHINDLADPASFAGSLKLFYAAEIAYYVIVGVTKISLLIFYLRIFTTSSFNFLRKLSYVLLVAISLLTVIYVVVCVFQCRPIALAWDKGMKGTCINVTVFFYCHADLNILADFCIYIMPMPLFWTVKRSAKERAALVGIFAVGGFVCLTGIIRLTSLKTAMASLDPSWDNEPSAIWSCIEADTGVICASLPSLKPLFADVLGRVPRTQSYSRSNTSRNFGALTESQTGLHTHSRADVELSQNPRPYKIEHVVVRTDEFRVEHSDA
ncbi:hypothetical protein KXW63_000660 [Aspergillus fumigatus]|nr:hypothetical protein KXW63_000660 [Aspergillus fumigatus]